MRDVWDLPGPARFVRGAAKDLSEGRSVIIDITPVQPQGIRAALDGALCEFGVEMVDIHLDDWKERGNVDPERVLSELFSLEISGSGLFSKALVAAPEFTDMRRVIWIDGMSPDDWRVWRPFIEEYEHVSRGIDEWERSVFALELVGTSGMKLPNKAVALAVHSFHGVVTKIDTLLHVSTLIAHAAATHYHQALHQNMVVELSGTDLTLAGRLCQHSIQELCSPLPLLLEVARERGWETLSVSPAAWHNGTLDTFEGMEYPNAAYLAVRGDEEEIERRLWRAQLSVIFPMIEEKRVAYISKMKGFLPLPYQDITDPRELEILHLYQMAKNRKITVQGSVFKTWEKLRIMRNALAHLETVPQEFLNDVLLFRRGV